MESQLLLPHNLNIWQTTVNWIPSQDILDKWQKLYELICQYNQHINLTRITQPDDFWEKNLWDCLAPIIPYELNNKRIIDVGTGAGFPGLPIAIAFPNCQMYLMDSISKKVNFIKQVKSELKLQNIETINARAEILGQDKNHREKYDFVLTRAVATISVCLEYSLPLLKLGGIAILYRGNLGEEELENNKCVAEKLGGEIIEVIKTNTPLSHNTRHNIYVKKIGETPHKYPRPPGKPTKKPLEFTG